MYLDIISTVFFLAAGFTGGILVMHMAGMGHAPKKISTAYILLMATGLLLLLLYAFLTDDKDRNIDTLAVFAVAMLAAIPLFRQHKKKQSFSRWLIFLHMGFTTAGIIWLSIHVLNELK